MVRTKADSAGRKAVGAKAPRKQFGASSSSSSVGSPNNSGGGKNKNSGGNPVKWWPSPKWQKGIGQFFPKDGASNEDFSEKPQAAEVNSYPGASSEELGLDGVKPIHED
ncbi:unnamed protein product [Pocillopora meandrina]|uniref:PCNA-associated factor n=1 Tax=Pocillopora meandrina TaxID=46732 RepID=A0AAU9VKZ8_9CNID|nr:unnamed protein product [Pocillopora meandrina]